MSNDSPKIKLALSLNWRLHQSSNELIVSAGADCEYSLELSSDQPSYLAKLEPGQIFTKANVPELELACLEELMTAGIIAPISPVSEKSSRIAIIGDHLDLSHKYNIVDIKDADLIVIARLTSTFSELLSGINYNEITTPHILVEACFDHMISIGPLVYPGETACLRCLSGRIERRWGKEVIPPEPRVASQRIDLVKELLCTEIDRIIAGDTGLVNHVFSYNIDDRAARNDLLLKLDFCPLCGRSESTDGRVLIPSLSEKNNES